MLAHISQAAPLNRPVLVIGERGTGKELVAGRLALLSPRWSAPLIKLNCGALPDALLDSELFGHEAGSFTGAARRRPGPLRAGRPRHPSSSTRSPPRPRRCRRSYCG